jgi:hypothetical protein
MNLLQSSTKVNLYAVDKNSTTALGKWSGAPSEIKDALREHNNSESERNGRHPTVTERHEEDDFKEQMLSSSVEKLINHTTTPKRKSTANLPTVPTGKKKKKRRKMGWSSKKYAPKSGQIEKFWYVGSDDQGDWYQNKWLGSSVLNEKLGDTYPDDYGPLLAKAKAKGSGSDVSWTSCAGNGEAAPSILNGIDAEVLCNGARQSLILHHHETKWCHLYSLLNVLEVSKTKGKKLRKLLQKHTGCLGDFSDIADRAAGLLHVSLKKMQGDVDFVLQQDKDKWLLLEGVHCISVDCARELIFDSGRTEKKALHLTKANLKLCGFQDSIADLRMVLN